MEIVASIYFWDNQQPAFYATLCTITGSWVYAEGRIGNQTTLRCASFYGASIRRIEWKERPPTATTHKQGPSATA